MNYFIYFTSGALFLLTTIQYRNWLKIVLHALSVVIQRLLQWMEECNHEGLMCLWVSPTYPLTLIFKPELAEVREDSFSRPFTIHLRYYIKATITSLKPTQKSHIDPVNGPARSKHLWYSSLHRSPFGFCDSHGFIPCRWCFLFWFPLLFSCLFCFFSFLIFFFAPLLRHTLGTRGFSLACGGITEPCLGVCHRPGEGGVLPMMAYTERPGPKGVPFIR